MDSETDVGVEISVGDLGCRFVFAGPAFEEHISVRLENRFVQAGDALVLDPSLPAFFSELHELWRGWDGERDWSSVTGNCTLSARHDRVGHVSLTMKLHDWGMTDQAPRNGGDWTASLAVVVEPSSLASIAERLRELL
jgi:hypothetical protein